MDHDADCCMISNIHPDILNTHILTRLDGPTLAALGTTSSELHALSTDEILWRDTCHRTWPSTANPLLNRHISSFPTGYRSFFANSSSTLHDHNSSLTTLHSISPWSPTLISAVDIHYGEKHLFSKVHEMDTLPPLCTESHFQVRLLDQEEEFPIPGKLDFKDFACDRDLENNLKVSWILIDPTHVQAGNLTTLKPVHIDRDWSNGDVNVRFGTILSGKRKEDFVQCAVVVTCGRGWNSDELHVKGVRLEVEDVEGNKLGWRESLVILQEAILSGERTRTEGKGGFDEFLEMKSERKEQKLRKERGRKIVEIWTSVVAMLGFSCLLYAVRVLL